MLEIYNGSEKLYQWDIDQKLIVEDRIIAVQYDNGTGDALICGVYELGGVYVSNVPNIMLQTDKPIKAYAYYGESVIADKEITVETRSRPNDYVYTETETLQQATLLERMLVLEQKHDKEVISVAEQIEDINQTAETQANQIEAQDNRLNEHKKAIDEHGLRIVTLENSITGGGSGTGSTELYALKRDVFVATEQQTFTNVFDTVAIEYGKLLNTDGTVTETAAALATTDYIEVAAGDVLRMEDFAIYNGGSARVVLYNSSKTKLQHANYGAIIEGGYYVSQVEADENGNKTVIQINKPSTVKYIKICTNTAVIGKNPILTINEEIEYKYDYGEKLNPKIIIEYGQIINAPEKNGWSILPYEHINIAYSSIGRKPINTVEHFTDAATNYKYNTLKADVRLTKDNKLICCHDAGFTFDANGYITTYNASNSTVIRDVNAATCLAYTHKTGEHPCLVSDYLKVCRKYGKVAFITIRNEYMDVIIPELISELKKHNMLYATIINSMTYESLVQWRTYDESVMINYTLNFGNAIDTTTIDRAVGLGYCSVCGFGLNSSQVEPTNECNFDYARENGIRLLQAIAYKEGSPEYCYSIGYDGCQIGYAWNG